MSALNVRVASCWILAGACLTVGAFSPALAIPIALVNAGFETPDNSGTDIVGWEEVEFAGQGFRTGTFTVPVPFPGAFSESNPEGARIAYIDATSRISQNSGKALIAGETYTLSAFLGNRLDGAQRPTDVEIYADNGLGGLGDLLAQVSVGEEGVPNGTWQQFAVTFDTLNIANALLVSTNLGRDLHVSIAHSQDETGGGEVDVDDVRFSYTAVPEPASLALLGLGGLLMLGRRRKA